MSEIDDIFSGKVPKTTQDRPPVALLASREKKRKSKKKRREAASSSNATNENHPGKLSMPSGSKATIKRPAPETIVDLSSRLKKQKIERHRPGESGTDPTAAPQKTVKSSEEGDRFADSRGSGPRASFISHLAIINSAFVALGKTTEEGWAIYKEDELGIGDKGGGESNPPTIQPCSDLHLPRHRLVSV